MAIEFRDFDGEVRTARLTADRHGPLRNTTDGRTLLKFKAANGRPAYVQIMNDLARAIELENARATAAHPPEPTEPATRSAMSPPPKGMAPVDGPLDADESRILKRLFELEAFDEWHPARQSDLVGSAGAGARTGTHFRNTVERLRRRGLVDTRRGLGTWLTPEGKAAARLSKRKFVAT